MALSCLIAEATIFGQVDLSCRTIRNICI